MLGKFFGRLYVKICRILLEAKQRVCGGRWCRALKHLWGTHAVEPLIKVFAEKILESLVSKLEIWEWNLGVQGVKYQGICLPFADGMLFHKVRCVCRPQGSYIL